MKITEYTRYISSRCNRGHKWGLLAGMVLLAAVSALLFFVGGRDDKCRIPDRFRYFSGFKAEFNDLNSVQMESAADNGIEPLEDEKGIDRNSTRLRKITSTRFYEVARLTHSHPYLVPSAKLLLYDIGKNFRDSLRSRNIPFAKLIVTSILRTRRNVRDLRRINTNATENSTHMYGTTMDIAYNKYKSRNEINPEIYKSVLAEVLRDLRESGRCYVMYELNQPCFHITVR